MEFKDTKSIDRPTMVRVLEDVFRTLIRKRFGSDENFDVIVSAVEGSGDLEIYRKREIVPIGEVEDDRFQISVTDAQALDPEAGYEEGETFSEIITIESFGRRAIMAARQTLISRILELEKDKTYKIYADRTGDLITGEVSQVLRRDIMVRDEATDCELMLPKSEMIRGDFYRKGEIVRAVIRKVEVRNGNPVIVLSRTDNAFLERLLEQEVPEIEDGLIIVRAVVRQPGERAKVAVESFSEQIEPIGTCVGVKGSRIHGIVRELRNENIDVIHYTSNDSLFIQRVLTPARVSKVEIVDAEKRRASVFLSPEEISKAIGKKGLNISLASKLCNYVIDVYREDSGFEDVEYDIDLDEFSQEIESWVLDAFKNIGCDTARDILELSIPELIRRTDLEEETVVDVLRILQAEFDADDRGSGEEF